MLWSRYMPDQEYATPWKHFADTWVKFGEGNHPSVFDLSVYEQFLLDGVRDVENPKVVLFGSTPEIRDMFVRHPKIDVTLLDINTEMMHAMKSLMKEREVIEDLVEGDWLSPPFEDGTFDVVMGDQIRCNVSDADQDTLYKSIHRILKPGGLHVTRITAHFPDTRIYTPEEVIEHFSALTPTKETITEFLNRFLFFTHRGENSPTDRFFSLLEPHVDKPNIQAYYDQFVEMMPRGKSWNVGKGWEHHKKVIEQYFDIEEQVQDDTLFADSTYIFKLKKRQ